MADNTTNLFTLPFLFGLAFIMIFTYAAEGILYKQSLSIGTADQDTKYQGVRAGASQGEEFANYSSFNKFLNVNYVRATKIYDDPPSGGIVVFTDLNYKTGEDGLVIQLMLHFYEEDAFDGVAWYAIHKDDVWINGRVPVHQTLQEAYTSYVHLQTTTVFTGVQRLFDFLGRIPTFFSVLVDMLTFNIKTPAGASVFPAEVQFGILLFMVPLWIVLIIGMLPYIIRIVEAIGAVLPDWL